MGVNSVASPWLSCSSWALVIKLKVSPLRCLSSLEVLTLFTILGPNTIVIHLFSSKYHLINRDQQFLQQRQKQQKKIWNDTKIVVPMIDNNYICFPTECLAFDSCLSTRFLTFSTLWLAKCKSASCYGMFFFLLEFLFVIRPKWVYQQPCHSSHVSNSMVEEYISLYSLQSG
jgi:hypothetical protein